MEVGGGMDEGMGMDGVMDEEMMGMEGMGIDGVEAMVGDLGMGMDGVTEGGGMSMEGGM